MPDSRLVQRFARLPVLAARPMAGGFSGVHRGLHRGAGVEFSQFRRYSPGDDITRVDWRVYGRSDRFYVKDAETESNAVCFLVVDASGSMAYASGESSKYDMACRLASTLAALLIRQGDAVGLTVAGGSEPTIVAPRRTPAHVGVICATLERVSPGGSGDVCAALSELAERRRRRGMVLVFTDTFCGSGALVTCLHRLVHRHHDVVLFQVLDAAERDFPFHGDMVFENLEGRDRVVLDCDDARDAYRERLGAHLERVRRGCREHRIAFFATTTERDPADTLAAFLGLRGPGVEEGDRWPC